jgi:hypothetical protein
MPVVDPEPLIGVAKFFVRQDLDPIFLFLGGHVIGESSVPEFKQPIHDPAVNISAILHGMPIMGHLHAANQSYLVELSRYTSDFLSLIFCPNSPRQTGRFERFLPGRFFRAV